MKFFDIHISANNKNVLSQINIKKWVDPFNHKGNPSYNKNPYDDIYQAIMDTGNNSHEIAHHGSQIISEMIRLGIDKLKKKMIVTDYNVILWLRFEPLTDEFIMPRWHIDGNYRVNGIDAKHQKKMLISLRGPGTLLNECNDNFSVIQQIREINREHDRYKDSKNIEIENNLIEPILREKCIKHQLQNFQGVMYDVGNSHNAGIHSEPNGTRSRILLGILVNEL